MVELLLSGVWGYLLGAVPTGVLVARAVRGADVRHYGSGHTGGLNVARVAGLRGGVLTIVGDGLLGLAATAGPALLTKNPWAPTAAGVMAVIGHDWSIFIRLGGGIGLAKLTGALLYLDPLRALGTAAAVTVLWLILTRMLNVHRARATILVMLTVGPLLWGLGAPLPNILLGVLGGAVVIIKTVPDWNRKYE